MTQLTKIVPYIWFDSDASDPVNFYVHLFPNSRIISKVMLKDLDNPFEEVSFELSGQPFYAVGTKAEWSLTHL